MSGLKKASEVLAGKRVLVTGGAGFVGSVLIKNNKLGEFIGDITKVIV